MTKQETVQLVTLIEQVRNIKEDTDKIIKHQEYQNGKLAEATLAIEKAREIAASADVKAEEAKKGNKELNKDFTEYKECNDKKVNRLYLLAAFALGTGFLSGIGLSSFF